MGTGNLEIFYNKVRNLLKYGYPSNTHIQLKKSKKISPENCANLLWKCHDPPQDVAQQKGYLRGLWSYAANLSFKAHSHILILTYILESLEAAPPVTLATSSADNSVLSSSSCFKSSSFFFPRSSWAFTFTCSAINQNNPTNETFANLLLFVTFLLKSQWQIRNIWCWMTDQLLHWTRNRYLSSFEVSVMKLNCPMFMRYVCTIWAITKTLSLIPNIIKSKVYLKIQ